MILSEVGTSSGSKRSSPSPLSASDQIEKKLRSDHQPSNEQLAILDLVRLPKDSGRIIKVLSGPGTGKSETLRMVAERFKEICETWTVLAVVM